ncbi:tubulin-tyrosine ligase family protein [Cystoisospora suis]|uniref:Tubulin-tyrosine ligase family protein n=1 Tax=Cystoisospora suis TaxID=483139 RepID=A0A2C6J7I2_9APIC|nr:tubulin-tyrosine ligase family protein [Cystoisospora suis]
MAPSLESPGECSEPESISHEEDAISQGDLVGDSRRSCRSSADISESFSFASDGDRDGAGQFDTFLCSVSEASVPSLSSGSSSSSSGFTSPPGKFRAHFAQTTEKVELLRRYLGSLLQGFKSLVPGRCDGGASCTLSQRTAGSEKSRSKAPLVTLDLTQAGKEKPLLQNCIRSLGWRANESFFATGDVAWLGSAITDSEHLDYGSACQVVNRLPGFHEFAKKRWLARVMCSMARLDPDGFSFFPKTWLLPEDRAAVEEALRGPAIDPSQFCASWLKPDGSINKSSTQGSLGGTQRGRPQRTGTALACPPTDTGTRRSQSSGFSLLPSWSASLPAETKTGGATRLVKTITTHMSASARKDRVFILKPDAGAQGAGLRLVSGLDQVPDHVLEGQDGYIVQQYICNPYLLNNRKFDFRVYVLVTSVTPKLQVFLSRRSLVRFCTEDYQPPRPDNMNNEFMHLTNYAINKDHQHFVRASHVHDRSNSKRLLDDVFEELRQNNVDTEAVWSQIVAIVGKVMSSLAPLLSLKYTSVYRQPSPRSRCFQIIGLDILLDSNCKAWLLEVNGNPSLRSDYDLETTAGFSATVESPLDRRVKEPLVSEALVIVYFSLLAPASPVHKSTSKKQFPRRLCISGECRTALPPSPAFLDGARGGKNQQRGFARQLSTVSRGRTREGGFACRDGIDTCGSVPISMDEQGPHRKSIERAEDRLPHTGVQGLSNSTGKPSKSLSYSQSEAAEGLVSTYSSGGVASLPPRMQGAPRPTLEGESLNGSRSWVRRKTDVAKAATQGVPSPSASLGRAGARRFLSGREAGLLPKQKKKSVKHGDEAFLLRSLPTTTATAVTSGTARTACSSESAVARRKLRSSASCNFRTAQSRRMRPGEREMSLSSTALSPGSGRSRSLETNGLVQDCRAQPSGSGAVVSPAGRSHVHIRDSLDAHGGLAERQVCSDAAGVQLTDVSNIDAQATGRPVGPSDTVAAAGNWGTDDHTGSTERTHCGTTSSMQETRPCFRGEPGEDGSEADGEGTVTHGCSRGCINQLSATGKSPARSSLAGGETPGACSAGQALEGRQCTTASLRRRRSARHRNRSLRARRGDGRSANDDFSLFGLSCCVWMPIRSEPSDAVSSTDMLDMCKTVFVKAISFPSTCAVQLDHWVALVARTRLEELVGKLWVAVPVESHDVQHLADRPGFMLKSTSRTCRRFAQRPLGKRDLVFLYLQKLRNANSLANGHSEVRGLCFWTFWELVCSIASLTRLCLVGCLSSEHAHGSEASRTSHCRAGDKDASSFGRAFVESKRSSAFLHQSEPKGIDRTPLTNTASPILPPECSADENLFNSGNGVLGDRACSSLRPSPDFHADRSCPASVEVQDQARLTGQDGSQWHAQETDRECAQAGLRCHAVRDHLEAGCGSRRGVELLPAGFGSASVDGSVVPYKAASSSAVQRPMQPLLKGSVCQNREKSLSLTTSGGPVFVPWWPDVEGALVTLQAPERFVAVRQLLRFLLAGLEGA